ncbi:MAG: FAD binding domain-containing protein, partial [Myxococcales bacterium]
MLRLPQFDLATPGSVEEAVKLLDAAGPAAMVVAGGTDLLPNMKHELFTPGLLVSLQNVPGLRGVRQTEDGALLIGAMTTLEAV